MSFTIVSQLYTKLTAADALCKTRPAVVALTSSRSTLPSYSRFRIVNWMHCFGEVEHSKEMFKGR